MYGEERRSEDVLEVLREAQRAMIPIDLRFYATVIDALASQVSRNRDRVPPEMEAVEQMLAVTCYRLLDEALESTEAVISYDDQDGILPSRTTPSASELLTLYHTAMKPASRLGDYERVLQLMGGLEQRHIPFDNITMSCILQAYSTAGKLSDASNAFDKFILQGQYPNGLVACVLINGLSRLGRYYESWLKFIEYAQKVGITVVEQTNNGQTRPLSLKSFSDSQLSSTSLLICCLPYNM
jgi:hypothetical protein